MGDEWGRGQGAGFARQDPGAEGGDSSAAERPSSDARHTAKATIWAAVLTSVVTLVVAVAISDGDDGNDAKAPQPTPRQSGRQVPAGPTGDGDRDGDGDGGAGTASPSPGWVTVWENQPFRFPPPPGNGDSRLIDFDASDGPVVTAKEQNSIDEETEPGDIDYYNQVYGYLQLSPGRQLGLAMGDGEDGDSPDGCRRIAAGLSFDPMDLGLMDNKRAASPVDVGSVLCMVTDQRNVVRIEVTGLHDPRPQAEEKVNGAYTLEGRATLWRPAGQAGG